MKLQIKYYVIGWACGSEPSTLWIYFESWKSETDIFISIFIQFWNSKSANDWVSPLKYKFKIPSQAKFYLSHQFFGHSLQLQLVQLQLVQLQDSQIQSEKKSFIIIWKKILKIDLLSGMLNVDVVLLKIALELKNNVLHYKSYSNLCQVALFWTLRPFICLIWW